MKDLGNNSFSTGSREKITIDVSVDRKPYLCKFQDPPKGSKWDSPPQRPTDTSEKRFFDMPENGQVRFEVGFDSAFSEDDSDDQATYTLKFSGSASGSQSPTRTVVVPKDGGPIPMKYTFTVT